MRVTKRIRRQHGWPVVCSRKAGAPSAAASPRFGRRGIPGDIELVPAACKTRAVHTKKVAARNGGHFRIDHRVEEVATSTSVLGRPGSDLLFQALRLSTIGAGEFNGRVRDGIGFGPPQKPPGRPRTGIRSQ